VAVIGSVQKSLSVLPAAEEKRLKDQVLNDLSKNLGMAVTAMSPELQQTVEHEIQRSVAESVQDLVSEFAEQQARALSKQPQLGTLFNDRLRDALSGILQVRQNADALKIMQENAKLLKMKYDSYVAAGFTTDQSFQIVLTEMAKPRRQ
jgi:hypothetical protein